MGKREEEEEDGSMGLRLEREEDLKEKEEGRWKRRWRLTLRFETRCNGIMFVFQFICYFICNLLHRVLDFR